MMGRMKKEVSVKTRHKDIHMGNIINKRIKNELILFSQAIHPES